MPSGRMPEVRLARRRPAGRHGIGGPASRSGSRTVRRQSVRPETASVATNSSAPPLDSRGHPVYT